MNHHFEPRLALHHRRGLSARQVRAGADDDDDDEENPKVTRVIVRTTATTSTTVTPVATTEKTPIVTLRPTTSLPTTGRTLPTDVSSVPTTTGATLIPTTSGLASPSAPLPISASSSTSIPSAPIPPPVASQSSAATSSSSSTTLRALGNISASAPSSSATSSSANENNSNSEDDSNTGAIAGGVVGGLVGFIAICAFVAFVVRHLRKRRNAKNAFSAAQFRRSALLLDDDKSTKGSTLSPRPPSMIERRAVASPAVPAAPSIAYGTHSDQASQYGGSEYSHSPYVGGATGVAGVPYGPATPAPQDPYGAPGRYDVPGRYGTPNPAYGGAPVGYNMLPQFEQYPALDPYAANMAAYGAGRPGYGAYGGADPRYAHPAQQHQQYAQYNNIPPNRPYGYGPGTQQMGPSPQQQQYQQPQQQRQQGDLPNPFTAPVAPAPSVQSSSPPPSTSSRGQEAYVRRQNSVTSQHDEPGNDAPPPAYVDDGSYANVQRDVKVRPQLNIMNGDSGSGSSSQSTSSAARPAGGVNNETRPVSSHTVYDPADAYGGM